MRAGARPGPRRLRLWIGLALGVACLVVAVLLTVEREEAGRAAASPRDAEPAAPRAELPVRDEAPVLPIGSGPTLSPGDRLPPGLEATDGEGRTITVRVADALGRAVPGAEVRAWTEASEHPEHLPPPSAKAAFIDQYAARGSDSWAESYWRKLSWSDPTWGPPRLVAKTDASGRAQLLLRSGSVAIEAAKAGVGTSACWTGDGGGELVLELRPLSTLNGVVLAASGQPVADAVVHCWPEWSGRTQFRTRRVRPLRTDAQGRFALEAPADSFLMAWALAGDKWSAQEVVVPGRGNDWPLELRFYGRFAIQGRALRPDGGPAAGMPVSVHGTGAFANGVTGNDGRFRFEVAQPGRCTVVARSEELISKSSSIVTLDDGAPVADVTIELVTAASISGRVAWDSGEDAPGFNISIRPARSKDVQMEDWFAFMRVSPPFNPSDESGRFEITGLHPSVVYALQATRTEDAVESESVEAASGSTDVVLVVDSKLAGLRDLDGRVVDDQSGRPITTYELRVSTMRYFIDALTSAPTTIENEDGRFVLEDLPREPHWLQVRAEGFPPRTAGPFTPGEAVEVRLAHLGTLVVTIVDETGVPVPGAVVRLRESAKDPLTMFAAPREERATADGHLVCPDLLPVGYALQATNGEALSNHLTVDLAASSQTEVTLRLDRTRPAGRLAVTARHADGRAYVGVSLVCTGSGDDAMPFAANTDAQGVATFGPLSPGTYMLIATRNPGFSFTTAEVEAGETTSVELTARD